MATFTILNNDGTIALPDVSVVQETISVYGLQGHLVTDVSVILNNLTHTFPQDLDMLLVGPNGTSNLLFCSDIGPFNTFPGPNNNNLTNASFIISDSGTTPLPAADAIPVTGTTYRPADYDGVGETGADFGPQAASLTINHPTSSGAATLAIFDNLAPNGTWALYIADDLGQDSGTLQSWGVTITTTSTIVAVNGTGGNDALSITFTGSGSGFYSLNSGQVIGFSGVTSVTFNGEGGSDSLNVTYTGSETTHYVGGNSINASPGFNTTAFAHVSYNNTEIVNFTTTNNGERFDFRGGAPVAQTNIFSGGGDDTFEYVQGVPSSNVTIDGGTGVDTVSYYNLGSAIAVNLGLGTTGLSATLEADQVMPGTKSSASGTVSVSNYNPVTRTFDIAVEVTGITAAEVTSFLIHRAGVGFEGPGIVDLQALGLLVPNGNGFTFAASGITLPKLHEAAFLGGFTYLDVVTSAFPDGAIRGQLFSNGNVDLASGIGSGGETLIGVENVFGSTGDDSIVGSFAVNRLEGGRLGDDTI